MTLFSALSETIQFQIFNNMLIHKGNLNAFVLNKIILQIESKFKSSYMFRPSL